MYIQFQLTCIMVLTFIHQDLLVYAQFNGNCVELGDLEPKDILSKREAVEVIFKNPSSYELKIIDVYFYESKRGRLNCTIGLVSITDFRCETKRSDRKSYPYNTTVDFVLEGECRDPTDNSYRGSIHVNLTNYLTIIDPVLDYVSPHSIFLNHSTLFVFGFKEIHPKHSQTLKIVSGDLECQPTTFIDKGANTHCKATKVPSPERVIIYLQAINNRRTIILDERSIPFVERPILSEIIEPIFEGSCHPIHITGQHLNSLEVFEFEIEKTGQTIKSCQFLNDTHYRCTFKNNLLPETASDYEKVSIYSHGSLLDTPVPLYLVVKPAPNIILVTYEFSSSTLTVHGENLEPEYVESLSIMIKQISRRSINKCSGPYIFDRENSTIRCNTERKLAYSGDFQALINISCYSIQFDFKLTGDSPNESWVEALIAFNIIILLYLCLCQSPLKAYFCSSKEKGQNEESKSGVIYTQGKITNRAMLGKSLNKFRELKGVSSTSIGPLTEYKSSPIFESASLKALIHGHKQSAKSSESLPNMQIKLPVKRVSKIIIKPKLSPKPGTKKRKSTEFKVKSKKK